MKAIQKLILLALAVAAPVRAADYQLFARTNLTAWCIVLGDAKQRGPEARAQMLENLGIKKLAYDWRAEQIPTFDAEVAAMKQRGVEVMAWWFPALAGLNAETRAVLDCIKRNGIHPQLWVMLEGGPHLRWDQAFETTPAAQTAHIERVAAQVKPIAAEAAKLGCQVALYNFGGWCGVPENQIEVIQRLKQDGIANVGLVYTQHHGYGEIDRFAELFPKMKPYLLAITLNGMITDGDLPGHNLGPAPLGQGDQDLRLLRIIKASGWTGPVGIVGEIGGVDVEARLQDQLAGLDWLVPQLDGKAPGPRPTPRVWKNPAAPAPAATTPASGADSMSAAFGKVLRGGMTVAGKAEYRQRPLTVECWAKLDSATGFNILVASDTKASAEHWELYTFVGSGNLSLYQPGRGGNFSTDVNICDSKWHYLAAVIEPERVRLFVDGKLVKDAPATPLTGSPQAGELAFGQLVEGGLDCDGAVDNVRLSRGAREISGTPTGPLTKDAITIGLWDFDETITAPARINPAAIVPVPRTDWAESRQTLVLQRAKDNPGACDIVFIGDSITHGWEGGSGKVWQKFYGDRKCLNFGVAGDLTEHVLWRFENGQLDGIKPKAVVLLIGTNNTGRDPEADILQGIQVIVKQLRARLADTKIILVAIFPRGQTFSAQRGKVLQVNQALAKLDDGKNIFYIDFGSQLIEADGSISKTVMPDYLHLSERGYEIWAEAIEPKLKGILGK